MHVSKEQIQQYRAKTYHTAPGLRVKSAEEAVTFVNERGFVYFWPVKNVLMPSLWNAAAGDRPVPNEHDDPGHVTWGWKDGMLGKRRWYYGRVLRKRNMFISLDVLPYFYALSPNYGDPDQDYLIDYEHGRLTAAAKQIYEALLYKGPLDTISLRKNAGLTSRTADSEYNHALDVLQTSFRILPVGVAEVGAWNYAFIYDIVNRHFPDILDRAHPISEPEARQKLVELYLRSVGVALLKEVKSIFGTQPMNWPDTILERDLRKMAERGEIILDVTTDGVKGPAVATHCIAQG
jgi:hypothetical protein